MKRLALAAFVLYQVIGLGVALSHPEVFIEVFNTTLEAMGGK